MARASTRIHPAVTGATHSKEMRRRRALATRCGRSAWAEGFRDLDRANLADVDDPVHGGRWANCGPRCASLRARVIQCGGRRSPADHASALGQRPNLALRAGELHFAVAPNL